MPEFHFLNLGAGVQSTTLYLMSMEQKDPEVPWFDCVVFADTQEEPDLVYRHLEWLQSLNGPPIVVVTAGKLGDALENGTDAAGNARSDGSHFISIPAYTLNPETKDRGLIRRQCTAEFKVKPVEKYIRQFVGATPGRPVDKSITLHQYMGLSYDEPKRVIRVNQRFMAKPKNWKVHFPLFELEMTRRDCIKYLKQRVPHQVPRSACVFCPFKTNSEWKSLKEEDKKSWHRALEIDNVCRTGDGLDAHRYLHSSCVPLEDVDLRTRDEKSGQMMLPTLQGFQDECEGYCGN